jgi:hypothetical protein
MKNGEVFENLLNQSLRIEAALGVIERRLDDIAALIRQKGSSAQVTHWQKEKDT